MGNLLSCSMSSAYVVGGPASVVFPSGETKKFASPTNVAELMLDVSDHFVVRASEMEIGRRFSPLAADEELDAGGVYVMVPMRRLKSIVTFNDMGFSVMTSAVSRKTSTVVVPEETEEEEPAAVKTAAGLLLDDMDEVTVTELNMTWCRMQSCKSRKPVLETIVEENSPA